MRIRLSEFTIIIINSVLIVTVYATIFTAVSMVFREAIVSTAFGLLLGFTMLTSSFYLGRQIAMDMFYYGKTRINGELTEVRIISENPNFPGEKKRNFYQKILYLIPTGNAVMMSNKISKTEEFDVENRGEYSNRMIMMSSVGEIIIFTLIGMGLFNKKQLK